MRQLPVSSRTRRKEELMYRKLHEDIIKRKKCDSDSNSSPKKRYKKNVKISSDSSCGYGVDEEKISSDQSLSFSGVRNFLGKRKKRKEIDNDNDVSIQNDDNVSGDFGFDYDFSVRDSNLGVTDHAHPLDLGSSNFESDGFFGVNDLINKSGVGSEKVSVKMEVEESCSGVKFGGNSGSFDSQFVVDDDEEIVEISDGSVKYSSDDDDDDDDEEGKGSDDEVTVISADGFRSSSSEESEDDFDDEDYRVENVETEEHFEETYSVSSDDGGSDIEEISSEDEAEKQKVHSEKVGERVQRSKIDSPLRKRTSFEGSFGDYGCDVREVGDKVGERVKKNKIESPLRKTKSFEDSFGDYGCDDVREVGDKVGGVTMSRRNKSVCQSKSQNNQFDIAEILGKSMFNDDVIEEVVTSEPEPPKRPKYFSLGPKELEPVEKTEAEKEIDELWAEFQLALCGEDTAYDAPVVNEAESSTKDESIRAGDCPHGKDGKHDLILDEQTGIICRLCSFVQQEINNYTVDFNKNPYGRSERRDYRHEQADNDNLHLHDFGNDTQYGNDFNSNVRGTVLDLIPGAGKDLHPHQRDGFMFLWKNIGGGIELDKLKEPAGSDKVSGCIVSHAPGTGKTRLAIVFLQTYMKMYPSSKPVIIAPCGMLLYWVAEFKKWNVNIPVHNLNDSKLTWKENKAALDQVRHRDKLPNRNSIRMVKLYSWKKEKSVLVLSYQLFKELVGEGRERKSKDPNAQKALLEVPSVVFLDEGHQPRNDQSQIWKALSKIHTKKRIILSGTPFQNTFDELYNTILLVRLQVSDLFSTESNEPCGAGRSIIKHVDKKLWNSLVRPIGKEDTNAGQEAKRLQALRDMIRPFVHVHEGNILQQKLPGLRDSVIVLQPDQFQKGLLDRVVENKTNFELEHLISLVSLHPSLMPEYSADGEKIAECEKLKSIRLNPDAGAKTKFLMELIRISDRMNEKVLVFSQYIDPLDLICDQLMQRFKWTEGREILHINGKTSAIDRQSKIKIFNNAKSEAKVMLASTKACSEGINLVGASRVVLVDVVWNPQVERQAISRAYRLGQTRVVYIYHLITCGTMEEGKYRRQARKERLSDMVFNSSERSLNHKKLSSVISDDKILESIVDGNKLKDILKDIYTIQKLV